MHAHTHTHVYKRIHIQIHTHMHIYTIYMSAHIHTYTYTHSHTKCTYERTHARLERRRGRATRKELLQTQEALHVSFVRRNQTTFRTSNTRTSLYPLPETLFYTDQMNRVHISEEVPRSFTMAPCVVAERLEGKQPRCSRAAVGKYAVIQARE